MLPSVSKITSDSHSWLGVASCASDPVRFQDSLIINISGRNQLISLSDHYQFLFVSMHLLSNLAVFHLVITCFLDFLDLPPFKQNFSYCGHRYKELNADQYLFQKRYYWGTRKSTPKTVKTC